MPQVNGHVRTVREADRSGSVVAVMENNDSDITEAVAKKPVLRGTRSATISPEKALETLQYSNGSKPQMIVWACRRDKEVCCGTECCPVESGISRKTKKIVQIIAIVIVSLILLCCCFSLIYFLCRAGNEMGPMGFEPYSPYYGPDYVPGPPICPPYPDFSNPGFIPPYVQPGYPPPRPIYPDPQPPGDPIYTSGNYAPRERSSETVDLQRR
ncbi:hypothetical protein OESDEN_06316 [Oesophagostomum dentatum]|uniref:CX domain-containing protein n=1 Tax=Oesophagostomum dentatum TaxID=61180 RepID=A0A0B1TD62_OESDE|nr:hypothetical protein OESDEN_06316 [Oesophagostomum dentatum]